MEFTQLLERYHISPLTYQDGTLLDKKDYQTLFDMFERYQVGLKIIKGEDVNDDKFSLEIGKIRNLIKNSLIPLFDEEVFDIMLNKEQQEVLK